MAVVTVIREEEREGGWAFAIEVTTGPAAGAGDAAGSASRQAVTTHHNVLLSWVDYDHWSHGRLAPERVAGAVVRFLIDRDPEGALPETFDASTIRRRFPELDERLGEFF